jgi:hypothetical protein
VSTAAFPNVQADVRVGGGARAYLSLAGAACFVVFGLALLFAPHADLLSRAVGVLTIAAFGPLPLYMGLRLLRVGCFYVLASDGIRFPMFDWPMLPWCDIQDTRIIERSRHRYLAIYVTDADLRLRQMRRGARTARWNMRKGLGLVAIPERMAPGTLERLQADIRRRQNSVNPQGTTLPVSQVSALTILPTSVSGRVGISPRQARALVIVTAAQAVSIVLLVPSHHTGGTHQLLDLAIGGALLSGAVLTHFGRLLGWLTIAGAEFGLVFFDLTAGHDVAVATRVLYLFFPACVLLIAAQTWPHEQTSQRQSCRRSNGEL